MERKEASTESKFSEEEDDGEKPEAFGDSKSPSQEVKSDESTPTKEETTGRNAESVTTPIPEEEGPILPLGKERGDGPSSESSHDEGQSQYFIKGDIQTANLGGTLVQEFHRHYYIGASQNPQTAPGELSSPHPSTEPTLLEQGPSAARGQEPAQDAASFTGPENLDESAEYQAVERDSETGAVTTTRYGSFFGPMSISKTITKEIGPSADEMSVGGCNVVFPEVSYKTRQQVSVTAEIDSSKWPKNFTAFTPMLDVDAKPRFPLRIRLPSWAVYTGKERAVARVMHKARESMDWEYTGTELPLTHEPFFEFDWQDFSPIIVGTDGVVRECRIAGGIYASDHGEVSIAFHLNDVTASTSKSLAAEWVSKQMSELSPPRSRKDIINQIRLKTDESISTSVEADDSEGLKFFPSGPFFFSADHDFIGHGSRIHSTALRPELDETKFVGVSCNVSTSAGQPDSYGFVITKKSVPKPDHQRNEPPPARPSTSESYIHSMLRDIFDSAIHPKVSDVSSRVSRVGRRVYHQHERGLEMPDIALGAAAEPIRQPIGLGGDASESFDRRRRPETVPKSSLSHRRMTQGPRYSREHPRDHPDVLPPESQHPYGEPQFIDPQHSMVSAEEFQQQDNMSGIYRSGRDMRWDDENAGSSRVTNVGPHYYSEHQELYPIPSTLSVPRQIYNIPKRRRTATTPPDFQEPGENQLIYGNRQNADLPGPSRVTNVGPHYYPEHQELYPIPSTLSAPRQIYNIPKRRRTATTPPDFQEPGQQGQQGENQLIYGNRQNADLPGPSRGPTIPTSYQTIPPPGHRGQSQTQHTAARSSEVREPILSSYHTIPPPGHRGQSQTQHAAARSSDVREPSRAQEPPNNDSQTISVTRVEAQGNVYIGGRGENIMNRSNERFATAPRHPGTRNAPYSHDESDG